MRLPPRIPPGERGVIRLFALSDQLAGDIDRSGDLDRLRRALGLEQLRGEDVQLVQTGAIADMGLDAFLREAYDIDPGEIAPQAETLNALEGDVAVLRSGAFAGREVHLKGDAAARLIAVFGEPPADWSATPLHTPGAHRRLSPRAARGAARRIGFGLFAGMMALILVMIYWMIT